MSSIALEDRPGGPGRSSPPPDLHAALVAGLYGGLRSLVGASVTALVICLIGWQAQDDRAYLGFAAAFGLVSAARVGANRAFARAGEVRSAGALQRWELRALAGACSFAGLTGGLAAYSVFAHAGDPIELLTTCGAVGYVAGISSRNAGRPLVTIGQIASIAVPFVLGLLSRPDVVHLALAAFVLALLASTLVMVRAMHETIVQRHLAHAELERAALYDPLTRFKNRAPFIEVVNALGAAAAPARALALLAVDLDRFKLVNDRFGHQAGDLVLVEAARRIAAAIGRPYQACRVGGDEFLVAVPDLDRAEAEAIAARICAALAGDFTVRASLVSCGASVGLALGPENGRTYGELMRGADLALYASKNAGRGRVTLYSSEIGRAFDARAELEENLRRAIARGELSLAYQPMIRCADGAATGFEALLRWRREGRAIPPSDFIPVAESTGLIVEIGAFALDAACREAAGWDPAVRVSVNLSPLQFVRGADLVAQVRGALARAGLAPGRLELEVTESLLIGDIAGAAATIDALRALGVGVALDDFGTGYSSLRYLKDFRFSKVKIDRALCRGIHRSMRSRSVLRCVVQLARDLGLEVVAEGIEEPEELEAVRDLGVESVQGYIYARPMPRAEVAAYLLENARAAGAERSAAARPTCWDTLAAGALLRRA